MRHLPGVTKSIFSVVWHQIPLQRSTSNLAFDNNTFVYNGFCNYSFGETYEKD